MPAETTARRPRFRRVEIRDFHLTERDAEMIFQLWRHRLLRTPHLISLLAATYGEGTSAQQVKRRLQLLYHHRYVDRVPVRDNTPMIYALGNRGADFLAASRGIPRPRGDWADKNRTLEEWSHGGIRHTLLIAEAMVAFEVACRPRGPIRLLSPADILAAAPEATRRRANPYGWKVPIVGRSGSEEVVGVVPDKILGLQFAPTTEQPQGWRNFYFFEADRGSEQITPTRNPKQSNFSDKMRNYYASWQLWRSPAGERVRPYGFTHFRVLTVTTSQQRVAHMIAENKRLFGGTGLGMFLFTDLKTLTECDNILTLPWVSGKGETVRLRGIGGAV